MIVSGATGVTIREGFCPTAVITSELPFSGILDIDTPRVFSSTKRSITRA